jgi:hypothetical protein
MNRPDRIAIVAHDSGGAEILSSFVRQQGVDYQQRCLFVLAGPAQKIFLSKLGALQNWPLNTAIRQASSVLCGTGWQSDLEVQSIALARQQGKKSIAFLDHWVNFRERFVRAGRQHLPDEIWVGDPTALTLAQAEFPETPIRLVGNPYFLDIKAAFSNRPTKKLPEGEFSILYVCEPVREHALRHYGNERHWGYTEEEALRYFLDNIQGFAQPVTRILIRPHPSEASDKYYAVTDAYDLPISYSDGSALFDEIAAVDWVAGCNSMAMVMGLLAGRQVICCIPPGGRPCLLPQPGIEYLRNSQKDSHRSFSAN